MNDIEKVKRHLSKPIPVTIKNQDGAEDIFYFKPLNIEQQAILMEISKSIRGREEVEIEMDEEGKTIKKKIPDIKKEDMNEMFGLILDAAKNSIEGIDEETAKDFCNTNFEQLSDALFKLMPENQSKEKVNLIKKKMEDIRNAKSDTESTE